MVEEIIWERNLACELGLVTNYHVLVLEGPGCFLSNPNQWTYATEDFPPCVYPKLCRV